MLLLVILTWILTSIVAALPVTDAFRSKVPDTVLLLENPFLDEHIFDLKSGKRFLLQSLVLYPSQDSTMLLELANQIQNSETWDSLLEIYKSFPEERLQLQIAERYG